MWLIVRLWFRKWDFNQSTCRAATITQCRSRRKNSEATCVVVSWEVWATSDQVSVRCVAASSRFGSCYTRGSCVQLQWSLVRSKVERQLEQYVHLHCSFEDKTPKNTTFIYLFIFQKMAKKTFLWALFFEILFVVHSGNYFAQHLCDLLELNATKVKNISVMRWWFLI